MFPLFTANCNKICVRHATQGQFVSIGKWHLECRPSFMIFLVHASPRRHNTTDSKFAPGNAKSPSVENNEPWKKQKTALKIKFVEEGWKPRKRLSPDALDGIRALHAKDPNFYTTPYLANQFEVSPEAVRRILKSRWQPNETERAKRQQRWERRGQAIWTRWEELGFKSPKKWRSKEGPNHEDVERNEQMGSPETAKATKKSDPTTQSLSSRIL